jgi:hypothetical protein
VSSSRAKTAFLIDLELNRFTFEAKKRGALYLLTTTFLDEVTSYAEAMRRFVVLRDWLQARGIQYYGLWQIQEGREKKTGAAVWHLHIFIDKRVDIVGLRAFLVPRGWGQQMRVDPVGSPREGQKFQDVNKAVHYVARYVKRDFRRLSAEGVRSRLVVRSDATRCGTVRFAWLTGFTRAWRLGCQRFTEFYGWLPHTRREREVAFDMGVHESGLLDFARITDGENPYPAPAFG